jgi:serine phosphatase RsbU (regulator of sigma subunit)/anti-sigma regulatory factor (Ser/Thr protein kinase)
VVRSLDASAERLDHVLTILAGAGRALAESRDIDGALSDIAGSVAAHLCDYCEIDLIGSALGREHRCVNAGTPPASSAPAQDAILENITDGHEKLGTITCRSSQGAFDDAARKAVAVLAAEIGAVLAARVVIRREHRVADRLQRALLPGTLPIVDGAEFHASYRPASDEAEVGGDWYDAFYLSDGRVALSIGDVAGHGLEAAVIMGEIRQAIRTAAVASTSPSAVLDYVNRAVTLRDTVGMVTAIFGTYDPASSRLSYAVAGHPSPLLALANGLVYRLPCGTFPLGCTEGLNSPDWTFTLPAGSHAIFYTDGLIENERDVFAGEKRLVDTARALLKERVAGAPDWDPASQLLDAIFASGSNRDDAATLFLSRNAPVTEYVFSAVPTASSLARAIVGDELATLGIQGERRFGVLVALGEAVANAVEHAYRDGEPGLIRVQTAREERAYNLIVEDFGRWRPFVRREHRGRGIQLMHAFMDGVQIRSSRDSTCIALRAELGEP